MNYNLPKYNLFVRGYFGIFSLDAIRISDKSTKTILTVVLQRNRMEIHLALDSYSTSFHKKFFYPLNN